MTPCKKLQIQEGTTGIGLRACNNLPQLPPCILVPGLRKIVACSQPYACGAFLYLQFLACTSVKDLGEGFTCMAVTIAMESVLKYHHLTKPVISIQHIKL